MKKNLISVMILTLVLVNIVLTAIMVFTIIPQTKKSNALIDEICAAIDLELEGGYNVNLSAVPIEDIVVYNLTDSFTVTLKPSGDGKTHYAVFSIGLSLNSQSEGYATYKGAEGLAEKETLICDAINTIVSSYTKDEFSADGQKAVKNEILEQMQSMFGSRDFIIGVNFSSVNVQ